MRYSKVNDREFVRVWQTARSCPSVGRQMNMTSQQASNHATWLRKKGVPLRVFKVRRLVPMPAPRPTLHDLRVIALTWQGYKRGAA